MALVLVVDDDAAVRDSIRAILEIDGHELVEAEDGYRCEAEIARRVPDLVVLDIFMPERDGFETIRSVRPRYPDLKILAISGRGDGPRGRTLRFAREFGANATLAKPFSADALRDVVRSLLREPRSERA